MKLEFFLKVSRTSQLSSRRPRFQNELAIVVAVHAEVEEDLAGARDEDGGADDAPVHASEEEQEHGEGGEGEPRVEVEGG